MARERRKLRAALGDVSGFEKDEAANRADYARLDRRNRERNLLPLLQSYVAVLLTLSTGDSRKRGDEEEGEQEQPELLLVHILMSVFVTVLAQYIFGLNIRDCF